MTKIMKVGNIVIYRERGDGFLDDLFFDGPTVTFFAYNGADCIKQETYLQVTDEQKAQDHFMELMDYYTLSEIHRAFRIADRTITSEYGGRLLSGKLAHCSDIDYFKRVDDTQYYKHFLRRPAM